MGNESKSMRYETQIQLVPNSMKTLNKQFALVDILLCYHGRNRNRTSISKEVIENALPSLYGIPIIGEWITKDDKSEDFGTHGGRIIIDDKGFRYEQTTKPFGFITKEAVETASWVTVTEKDGFTQHEYLSLKGAIVWKDRYEEVCTLLDENRPQSMEISISKGKYDSDDYYIVEEMTFSAACILGTDVVPCFESACIGRHYELDSFKQEFSFMLDEYKKFSSNAEPNNNTTNKSNKEEKAHMELSKFTEALSIPKIEGTENAQYTLLSVDDDKVFALDMTDYKPYGFNYAITTENDAENLVVDFDSKVEMSLSATEKIIEEGFNEFNIQNVIDANVKAGIDAEVHNQTEILQGEFNKKVDELKQSYEDLSVAHKIALEKLEKFEVVEAKAKAQKHEEDVNAVFEKFATKLSKCAEFLVYKAKVHPADVTLEEVTEKLTLMAGKFAMESTGTKANFSYQPQETKVTNKEHNEVQKRYGNLLSKYMK
jgi:hypothetical protein